MRAERPQTVLAPDRMRFSQLLDKSASKKDVLELTSALALEQPLRAEDGELALRALGRKNCWEEALAWMATMQTSALQPSVICYNATMSACFRSAQWQRSLLCFDSLRASGCPPNAITFSAAISACHRGGLWVEALELLEEMRARDVEIDKEHYSAVLASGARSSKWEHTLTLFEDMFRYSVEPDPCCYAHVGEGFGAAGHWRGSLALIDLMRTNFGTVDVRILDATMRALRHSTSLFPEVLSVYADALARRDIAPWNGGCLDVHFFPVEVAATALQLAVLDMVAQPSGRRWHDASADLIIITGRGHGNHGEAPVLRTLVLEWLVSFFDPPLEGHVERDNPGRVMVLAGSLQRWAGTHGEDTTEKTCDGER